jgi:TonB family protein
LKAFAGSGVGPYMADERRYSRKWGPTGVTGDAVFAVALAASLVFHVASVGYAGRRIAMADTDITKLVFVDVRQAREAERRHALLVTKTEPARARETARPAPRPVNQDLPRASRPAPVLVVKAPRVVAPRTPGRPASRSARTPDRNAGSRLAVVTVATRAPIPLDTADGFTRSGESGSGFGAEEGVGTGEGAGRGAETPVPNPPGAAEEPPREPAASVPQTTEERPAPEPAPTPAISAPEPVHVPEPPPPPAPKPVRRIADRANAEPSMSWVTPDPPGWLSEEGGGGEVVLEITVTPEGTVGEVKVVRSTDHRLDSAAVAAAKKMKFKPAVQNGESREDFVRHTYIFSN